MSGTMPTRQYDIYGVLFHPSEPLILLLPDAGGWSLPHIRLENARWFENLAAINTAMQQALGIETTMLRLLDYTSNDEKQHVDLLAVLENHSQPRSPGAGAWFGRAALTELTYAQPHHQAMLDTLFEESERGQIPALRTEWEQLGWFQQAAEWIRSELTRLGYTPTGPVEQVKTWCMSSVLRVQTSSELVYFKVASSQPMFVNEPVLLQALARFYPKQVPVPLGIDEARRWILLASFGSSIGWNAPVEVQDAMLRAYSQFQNATAAQVEQLLALGCLDRRLERLIEQIDPLLEAATPLAGHLEPEEIARLQGLGPQLKELCKKLASYAVPYTLVHGDLHLNNVALQGEDFVFFDWTDGCIAHPFFDTICIFNIEDPLVQAQLRDSYLRVWEAYEPVERLLEAWALAKPLCALHQAVSYQYITAYTEEASQPSVADDLPFWLRLLLQSLDSLT